MYSLLCKLFIKNYQDTDVPEVRQAYGMISGALGIALNVLLFVGKFFAGLISHSIAITADAFNNLSDAGASFITLAGFKLSGQKPDTDHPFGHGRFEYLSGLFVAVIILLMGFELLKSSVNKILHPEALDCSVVVIVILLASICVKLYMAFYNRRFGKKLNSTAMIATATDSLSDTVATTVVLVATLISKFSGIQIDGWCGLLVALFILYAGVNSMKDTINPLLGQAPEPEFVADIERLVLEEPEILGVHDLIVHDYGPGRRMISLHAEVSAEGDIVTLHDMIDNTERKLRDTLHCEAVIHMDPVCVHDEETITLKHEVTTLLHLLGEELTLHDFRVVKGNTHTNLIFDIVLPYHFMLSDEEVVKRLQKSILELHPNYYAVISVDKMGR